MTRILKTFCKHEVIGQFSSYSHRIVVLDFQVCFFLTYIDLKDTEDIPWMTTSLKMPAKKKYLYIKFLTNKTEDNEKRKKMHKNKLTAIFKYCKKNYYYFKHVLK